MSKRKNKGIHVKFRKERGTWEIVEYLSGNLKRHATGLSTSEEAERKLTEILIDKRSTEELCEAETEFLVKAVTTGIITIEEAQGTEKVKSDKFEIIAQLIVFYTEKKKTTGELTDTTLKNLETITPFWGKVTLLEIVESNEELVAEYTQKRKEEFKEWMIKRKWKADRELKPGTIRRELEQLQAVINFAHQKNKILIAPIIEKPDRSEPRERWLTHKEAAELLKAAREREVAKDYLPLFVLLGLYTGARSAAIFSLEWDQVNFQTNFINFFEKQKSKNKRYSRVPMPRRLRRELLKTAQTKGAKGFVINDEGKPLNSVKKSFFSACADAGLKNVTPHTLRHTAVSWMVQKGLPYSKIGKYVGMSTQMVERVYGHLSPNHLQDVVDSYG